MIRKLFLVLSALVLFGSGRGAFAAESTGNLTGYVFDQAGTPLRGITVTATSKTQIGGAQSDVTNDTGAFRIQGLYPGTFTVRVTAPKLKTLVHEGVKIVAANTTNLDLIMEVETVAEEVKIIQRAPIVNTSSTKVGVDFDEEFMNSLPLQTRDYQGVAALTPGMTDSGDGNPQSRGGTYFSNSYTVDGFNTTDPVTRTFGQNFSFNSMANLEVSTSGGGAEASATSGGTINIVTKSGSNRFEADLQADYSDHNMQLLEDRLDQGQQRIASVNAYVGGPIMKDVLWYAISGQLVSNTFSLPTDPNYPVHPAQRIRAFDGLLKLTWNATPRNQFEFLTTVSPAEFNNALQSLLVESEAEARQFQRSEFVGVTWQYRGEIFFINRIGYKQQMLDVGPQRCQWDSATCTQISPQVDLISGIRRENYGRQSVDQRRSLQYSGHAEWIKDSRRFGGHSIRLGYSYEAMKNDVRTTVPGDASFGNIGTDPFSRTTYCSNDPLMADGVCSRNFLRTAVTGAAALVTLSDAYKPTRYLTLKPGVAFHYGSSENDRGVQVTDVTAWTPHFAAIWDPTRDGKTKIQASVDGIVDTGFLALARFTSRQLYSQTCDWDPTTQSYSSDCRASGGSDSSTVGLPCGPTGYGPDGKPCLTKLRPPRVWDATIGGEREIANGIALGATFIYRKFVHQWEDAETNANWNEGGTDLRRDGPFKSSRSQFVFDLQTPDSAQRRYKGVTALLRKREGRMKAVLAYTLSSYEGVDDASFASSYLDNPSQASYFYGPLSVDNRHDVRALVTYQMTPWLSTSATYQFHSGGPYNRYFFDPVYGSYSRFQAQRGYDARGNTNPDDDLQLRLPDISELALQVRANFERILKVKLDAWADVLNVLALRTTTAYFENDGPNFGRTANRLPPMRVRVGLRYRY
jgi:hypothetical protein